eukprot:m.114425 g.114425  ORF g.114425 m.114425 type:complete len:1639 (+) comp37497_c0_seq1:435-5351(+)
MSWRRSRRSDLFNSRGKKQTTEIQQTVARDDPQKYSPGNCPLFEFGNLVDDCLTIKRISLQQSTLTNWWMKPEYVWHLQDEQIKMRPLFRKYGVANFLLIKFPASLEATAIKRMLSQGLQVSSNGIKSTYRFFGHSASQLRQRECLLFSCQLGSDASALYAPFGNFDIKPMSKKMARIGLLLSDAEEVATLTDSEITEIADVERNGFNFTDGCGRISLKAAREVVNALPPHVKWLYERQKTKVPSVYQIRLQGCKGVLALDVNLPRGIQIRPSMKKFEWRLSGPHILALVGLSRPVECGKLNRPFIQVLSCLGVPDRVFLQKQKDHFRNVEELLDNANVAITYLSTFGYYELAAKLMQNKSHPDVKRHLRELQRNLQRGKFAKKGRSPSEKLQIPIQESRFVYGISDPSNSLQYGQCFFQPTIRGDPQVLVDVPVMVGRSPAHHAGDIRRLRCVDVAACRHLVDCIVFPVNGDRPHADEMAGGDLDGDKFFVCWDSDLVVSPFRLVKPCDYRPPAKWTDSDDAIDLFSRYDVRMLSDIDRLFNLWADCRGIRSVECQKLAMLFSDAVDAAKTGTQVTIPQTLTAPPRLRTGFQPVWLTMKKTGRLFVQDNAIAALHRTESISEDALADVVKDLGVNFSDYQLFRLIWKWWIKCGNPASSFKSVAAHINFSRMSVLERRLALIDVTPGGKASQPVLPMSQIFNALYQSKIFCAGDLESESFRLDKCGLGWRAMPFLTANSFTPSVLTALLRLNQAKLFLYEFLIDGVSLALAILFGGSFPFTDNEKVVNLSQLIKSEVTSCLVVRGGDSVRAVIRLDRDYSVFWDGTALQLYRGSKINTFIFMQFTDEGPKVSVALDRFNAKMKDRQTRVKKETYKNLEVYTWTSPEENLPILFRPKARSGREESDVKLLEATDESWLEETHRNANQFEELCVVETMRLEGELKEKGRLDSLGGLWRLMTEATQTQKAFLAPLVEPFLFRGSVVLESASDYLDVVFGLLSSRSSNSLFAVDPKISSVDEEISHSSRIHRLLSSMHENKIHFGISEIRLLFDKAPFSSNLQEAHSPLKFVYDEGINSSRCWTPAFDYYRKWTARLCTEMLEKTAAAREGTRVIVNLCRGHDANTIELSFAHGSLDLNADDAVMLNDSKESREYVLRVCDVTRKGNVIATPIPSGEESPVENLLSKSTIWDAFCLPSFGRYFLARKMLEDVRLAHPSSDSSLTVVLSSLTSSTDEREVITKMFGSLETVTLIDGPPGTGKTQKAAEIACGWLKAHRVAVLVVTATKSGKKVLIKRIKALRKIPHGDIIDLDAVGERKSFDVLHERDEISSCCEIYVTSRADFVTLLHTSLTFTYVVVDEASLLPEWAILPALLRGCRKLVMIGDLQQNCSTNDDFHGSLYHRLQRVVVCPHQLSTQHRMLRGIAEYPLQTFYHWSCSRVASATVGCSVSPRGFCWPCSSYPVAFVNVDRGKMDDRQSKVNREEVEVKRIVDNFCQGGDVKPNNICVVTACAAQAECIRRRLNRRQVEVKAVDDLAGEECDILVFSAVKSNYHGSLGGLNDLSLIHRVLTRAKRGLIVIGSEKTLKNGMEWSNWLDWIEQKGLIVIGKELSTARAETMVRSKKDGKINRRHRNYTYDKKTSS